MAEGINSNEALDCVIGASTHCQTIDNNNAEEHSTNQNNSDVVAHEGDRSTFSFSKWLEGMEGGVHAFLTGNNLRIKKCIYVLLAIVYLAYFTYCMQYKFGDEGSIVLLVITTGLFWKCLLKCMDSQDIVVAVPKQMSYFIGLAMGKRIRRIVRYLAYIIALVAMVTYLSVTVFPRDRQALRPFVGIFVLIVIGFITSAKPSKINWHPVLWSFTMQFVVAILTLRTRVGFNLFEWLGDRVQNLLSFGDIGSEFVIGKDFRDLGLAFSAAGLTIFVNAFVFLLTHWGVIEIIVLKLGRFLAFCLGTGPVESVVAAANVFIGLTEAPLLIRPYLPTLTDSELHSIMACGFASISAGALALFIQLGAPANHLLTAAVISAPAALAFSKMMCPETDQRSTTGQSQANIRMVDNSESNALSVFSEGAVLALTISAAVWANMLAFVSVLALVDAVCVWVGERAGVQGLTFSLMCSYALFPLAYVIGVPLDDCRAVGRLIGVRWFATPFVAYTQLGDLIENRKMFADYTVSPNNSWHKNGDDVVLEATGVTLLGGFLQERTEVITTYALCGFSSFSAIGICLGVLVSISPNRKSDIIRLVPRAFVAGNMASFATGAIAGMFFTPDNKML